MHCRVGLDDTRCVPEGRINAEAELRAGSNAHNVFRRRSSRTHISSRLCTMRVFVTGLGVVSSHGDNLGSFWENLLSAKDGSCEIDLFDVGPYETKSACLVPSLPGEKRELRGGRTTDFAFRASRSALIDAQWTEGGPVGVVIGTTTGELNYLEAAG